MPLSDLATIASIVSSLAVAVSLVYLGVQTHQAAKHTRALISQGRSARQTDFLATFSDSDRVAALLQVMTGMQPTAESIRQTQTLMFFQACFAGWTDVFEQHQENLLSDEKLADLHAGISDILRPLPARQFWEQWKAGRANTHAAFKAWVDEAIAAPPPGAA